jgi:hypothetical protein
VSVPDYKSRFFVADGLVVDVSRIVSVTYPVEGDPVYSEKDCRIAFSDSASIYPTAEVAAAVAAYIVEFEQWQEGQWARYRIEPTLVSPAVTTSILNGLEGLTLSEPETVE